MADKQSGAILKIAIVGSDLHAWSTAARLAVALRNQGVTITVVAASEINPPPVVAFGTSAHAYHQALGVREVDLIKHLNGAYRYGTRYLAWGSADDDVIHTFSPCGEMLERVHFHHFLSRLRLQGETIDPEHYSLAASASRQNKFTHPQANTPYQLIDYAMQFDGHRYAQFIRSFALDNGVKHVVAGVHQVVRSKDSGDIQRLVLTDQSELEADFLFDASGSIAALISGALHVPWKSWSNCLPYDQQLELMRNTRAATPVVNKLINNAAGWLRTDAVPGVTFAQQVYCSKSTTADQALAAAEQACAGDEPLRVSGSRELQVGIRTHSWQNNCVAVGAAAASLTPLYFDEYHFTHTALDRWLSLYPLCGDSTLSAEEYNRMTRLEYASARDIHTLRLLTERPSSEPTSSPAHEVVWPNSLLHRVALFEQTGQVAFYESDLLEKHQWVSLFMACGIWPQRYDPLAAKISLDDSRRVVGAIADKIVQSAHKMPDHDALLRAIRNTQ
ncbi:tryptophan 7-halogenase [Arenicella xantha]|uniref:Tryptophan halogenase n=1 Tax=Arenicella xantha TaxID=644221 RepID=A0A395JNW5_9GAMM|nr:tryptophan 7-halogenase [Arenicella xantha]RBP53197.1 tryptophan halogenase [Arenicella xantha]